MYRILHIKYAILNTLDICILYILFWSAHVTRTVEQENLWQEASAVLTAQFWICYAFSKALTQYTTCCTYYELGRNWISLIMAAFKFGLERCMGWKTTDAAGMRRQFKSSLCGSCRDRSNCCASLTGWGKCVEFAQK